MSLRLIWEPPALEDLAHAADWSRDQARAVVEAMERMAEIGWSLGRPSLRPGLRYWPVPPLGVFDRVVDGNLRVVRVVDARRLTGQP